MDRDVAKSGLNHLARHRSRMLWSANEVEETQTLEVGP